MSHSTQPVCGAHGSTRKVVGSAIIRKSPPPSISAMPKPPPGVNTGNTVLCAVSLASSVVVIEQPLRITARGLVRHHGLAAQDAVLVGKRQADDLEPVLLDPLVGLGRGLELLVAPQPVALDEAVRGSLLR